MADFRSFRRLELWQAASALARTGASPSSALAAALEALVALSLNSSLLHQMRVANRQATTWAELEVSRQVSEAVLEVLLSEGSSAPVSPHPAPTSLL
jgi:hypothetical protein